jgi:cytochrome c556
MKRIVKTTILATALLLPTGFVLAQEAEEEETPEDIAVEIRHGHMLNYAANLQRLGAMAQGNAEYDAAVAQTAADNLVYLASIDQSHYWLPGTAQGEHPESAALPAIWENTEDFNAKNVALREAVTNLQSTAGTDLASLQGAMQGVGQACGACHENYRAKEEE